MQTDMELQRLGRSQVIDFNMKIDFFVSSKSLTKPNTRATISNEVAELAHHIEHIESVSKVTIQNWSAEFNSYHNGVLVGLKVLIRTESNASLSAAQIIQPLVMRIKKIPKVKGLRERSWDRINEPLPSQTQEKEN